MKHPVSRAPMIWWRWLRWVGLAAVVPILAACVSRTFEPGVVNPTATVSKQFTQKINNQIDILFMVDNSSSMSTMQDKLLQQLPVFMQVLKNLPMGLPSLHVAVVTSDMGARSDNDIGCTQFGNAGAFQFAPQKTCTNTTLTAGSTFIAAVDGTMNFTDPIETVFQCIAATGDEGCGFEQPLASIDRALGADNRDSSGKPQPPASNAGFLRDDAYLGIVMLTNEDDASAPADTNIFSLAGAQENISNPDGPLANYRQNGGPRGPHLCQDPASADPTAYITEPIKIPADAQGTASAPTLHLENCKDNDSGSSAFFPVQKFVDDIKLLKPNPDDQILVAGIIAPTSPVEVGWYPPKDPQNPQPGELWPDMMHSCGPQGGPRMSDKATQFTTDGSFGDPGIRVAQFIKKFPNYVIASICDPSYASSMTAIATKLGQLITPPCITGTIQKDSKGNPMCTVTEQVTDAQNHTSEEAIPNCAEKGNAARCWSLTPGGTSCTAGVQLQFTDTSNASSASERATVDCSLCLPGSTEPGC